MQEEDQRVVHEAQVELEGFETLRRKLESRTAAVCVMGLGYVGLPTSILLARHFQVHGLDTDQSLVEGLSQGLSTAGGVSLPALSSVLNKSFFPTTDERIISQCDFILIAVPTPLKGNKEPNLEYVIGAAKTVARHLRRGHFIILSSTTYPGTTQNVLIPALERSGLRAGQHFGVAYSPERLNPGGREFAQEEIPKVVGAIDEKSADIARRFFGISFRNVIPVSSCETAEAVKILENIFRAVNIALINELTLVFDRMNINTWEVIEAASSKPYGFMPFFPGPGVGGHCIPLDPFYLSYRSRQFDFSPRFIELSGELNEFMKAHTVNMLVEGLFKAGKRLAGSEILVLGLAYKKGVSDTRESPAEKVIEEIHVRGGSIRVYDPLAKEITTDFGSFESAGSLSQAMRGADAVLILVDSPEFTEIGSPTLLETMRGIPVIVDMKNALAAPPKGAVYIGLGKGRSNSTRSVS